HIAGYRGRGEDERRRMGALVVLVAAAGASLRHSAGVEDRRHGRHIGPAVAHCTAKLAGLRLPAQVHHLAVVQVCPSLEESPRSVYIEESRLLLAQSESRHRHLLPCVGFRSGTPGWRTRRNSTAPARAAPTRHAARSGCAVCAERAPVDICAWLVP